MLTPFCCTCLNLPVFQAGHPLTGKVVLRIRRPLRDGGDCVLHIDGKEKVNLTNNARGSLRAERNFFRVHLPLKRFRGMVMPGTYSFPFTIDLPASLPSSTKYPTDRSEKGFSIQYQMLGGLLGKLQYETQVSISSAPLPDEPVQCMIEPTSFTIKAAKLFTKGTVSMGASVTDSQVGRGQALDLHLACRNQSTTEIRRVEIKLIEHLSWTNKHKLQEDDEDAPEATIELLSLSDVDLSGLDKYRRKRSDVRNEALDPLSQATTLQEIYDELLSGHSNVSLQVPFKARDSYSGQIIRISHYLQIKLQTGRMQSNPALKIPIRIGTPPTLRLAPGQRPTDISLQPQPVTAVSLGPEIQNAAPQPAQHDEIPIVAAVSIPNDAIEASMTTAGADVIVLGGDAVVELSGSGSLADLIPVPPPSEDMLPVSMERLFRDMSRSIDDYGILTNKLSDPAWRQLIASLSTDDYGRIISRLSNPFDQPRVATLLAPHLAVFSCAHAAAAVRNSSEWNRSAVAQWLLPHCVDIATDHELIRNELNEWDRTVTANDFQAAINSAKGNPLAQQ